MKKWFDWRKWMLVAPVLFVISDAWVILKHVPALSLPWMLEIVALFLLAGIFWKFRQAFLPTIYTVFLANFAWSLYLLQHHL